MIMRRVSAQAVVTGDVELPFADDDDTTIGTMASVTSMASSTTAGSSVASDSGGGGVGVGVGVGGCLPSMASVLGGITEADEEDEDDDGGW